MNADSFLADASECPDNAAFKNLLGMIIYRAILDYYPSRRTRIIDGEVQIDSNDQRSAFKWLHSKKRHEWSFIWVCEHLDLSPKEVLDEIGKNYGLSLAASRHRVSRG